jgi:type IV pilus assembly protein PilN
MIRLNLLPWREALRRERKQQFQRQLGLVAVLALSVVLAIFMVNAGLLNAQIERNQLLTAENAKLDASIGEIKQLETHIAALNARRIAVDQLQTGRCRSIANGSRFSGADVGYIRHARTAGYCAQVHQTN